MEWNLRFSLSNPIDPHIDHKVNIQMSNFMKFAGRKGGSLGRLHCSPLRKGIWSPNGWLS